MLGCFACAYSRYSGGIESSGENGQLVFGLALVAFGFSTFLPSLVRWSVSHGACAGKLLLVPFRKLFKSTLNNRLCSNLACVIDESSRGVKLKRAFEELPLLV